MIRMIEASIQKDFSFLIIFLLPKMKNIFIKNDFSIMKFKKKKKKLIQMIEASIQIFLCYRYIFH